MCPPILHLLRPVLHPLCPVLCPLSPALHTCSVLAPSAIWFTRGPHRAFLICACPPTPCVSGHWQGSLLWCGLHAGLRNPARPSVMLSRRPRCGVSAPMDTPECRAASPVVSGGKVEMTVRSLPNCPGMWGAAPPVPEVPAGHHRRPRPTGGPPSLRPRVAEAATPPDSGCCSRRLFSPPSCDHVQHLLHPRLCDLTGTCFWSPSFPSICLGLHVHMLSLNPGVL